MSVEAGLTLAAIVVAAGLLIADRYSPLTVLGGAVVALMFVGVIEPATALSGFSSQAPATVAALYVVAGAATATGLFAGLVDRLLSARGGVTPLAAVTALLSSLVPNTPLVAMLAPRVMRWTQRHGVSASRYLLPLSYASLLGGVITVIGTSTNLIVSDLLVAAGHEPLGVFEMTAVGLPVAVAGIIVLATIGVRLLPDRGSSTGDLRQRAREFQMTARVDADGPLVGRTIAESGLRSLDGVFLAMIERTVPTAGSGSADERSDADDGDDGGNGHDQHRSRALAASPDTVLEAGDLCCFVGDAGRVIDLHEVSGLTGSETTHVLATEAAGTEVFEAVIAPGSALVGSSLRSSQFRARYGGAVMAIHRADDEVGGQLGRVELRAGDVLLVLADQDFVQRWRNHRDFSLVAPLDTPAPARRSKAWLVAATSFAMLALAASGVVSLLEAAIGAALVLVAGGAVTSREGWRAVNVQVVATMAVAISLGGAVSESGLAADVAGVVERFGARGEIALVAATMIGTVILTELVTNAGAAALMIPIAISTAAETGADPRTLAIAVLIGASCSFLSPIGYQTNLMVFGLGNYRFTDFPRVGLPLTVTTVVTATTMLALT